jgi:hypothetical protein
VLLTQVKATPFRSARQKKKKKERKKEIKKNKNKNKKKSLKTRRLLLRHYFRYSSEKYGQVKHRNKANKITNDDDSKLYFSLLLHEFRETGGARSLAVVGGGTRGDNMGDIVVDSAVHPLDSDKVGEPDSEGNICCCVAESVEDEEKHCRCEEDGYRGQLKEN